MNHSRKLFDIFVLTSNLFESIGEKLALSRMKVLFLISEYAHCSPAMLMKKIGLKKSNLAPICKELEEVSLIKSEKRSTDARKKEYVITDKGENVLDKYFAEVESLECFKVRDELKNVQEFLNKKI